MTPSSRRREEVVHGVHAVISNRVDTMSPRRRQPTRFVALLRGVNVSGHRKVPMAELRRASGVDRTRRRGNLPPERQRGVHERGGAGRSRARARSGDRSRLGVTTTVLLPLEGGTRLGGPSTTLLRASVVPRASM